MLAVWLCMSSASSGQQIRARAGTTDLVFTLPGSWSAGQFNEWVRPPGEQLRLTMQSEDPLRVAANQIAVYVSLCARGQAPVLSPMNFGKGPEAADLTDRWSKVIDVARRQDASATRDSLIATLARLNELSPPQDPSVYVRRMLAAAQPSLKVEKIDLLPTKLGPCTLARVSDAHGAHALLYLPVHGALACFEASGSDPASTLSAVASTLALDAPPPPARAAPPATPDPGVVGRIGRGVLGYAGVMLVIGTLAALGAMAGYKKGSAMGGDIPSAASGGAAGAVFLSGMLATCAAFIYVVTSIPDNAAGIMSAGMARILMGGLVIVSGTLLTSVCSALAGVGARLGAGGGALTSALLAAVLAGPVFVLAYLALLGR